jgi:hypothetical protein
MTNLSDIIERLEKAEAGSRELDCWIGYIADLQEDDMSWRDKIDRYGINHAITSAESRTNIWSTVLPRYTTSVDAAISLAEKVLPGSRFLMGWGQTPDTLPWARVGKWEEGDATGPTLAIALCLAILKAKAQQQEGGE